MEFVVLILFVMGFFYIVKWGGQLTDFFKQQIGFLRDKGKPLKINQRWTNGLNFLRIEAIEEVVYYTNHVPTAVVWSTTNRVLPSHTKKKQETIRNLQKILHENRYYLTDTIPNQITLY